MNTFLAKEMRGGMLPALLLLTMLSLMGCKTPQKATTVTFYPPAPDEPRIQFLTSFSSETELGAPSKFNQFVVGGRRIVRPIWKPYGIGSAKGKIFICDTQAKNLGTVDLEKKTLRFLRPSGDQAMLFPVNVAIDESENRYVTDTVRGQVLIYDKAGTLQGTIGEARTMKPCGIALSQDRIFVTDLSNHCVRVYQKATRAELFQVPRDPQDEKSKLRSPTNIALDAQGRMFVSDTGGFTVQVYDAEGQHLRSIGEMGIEPGRFALPKGIGVSPEGIVYVVDAAANVAQMFDSEGRVLMYFGQPNTPGSLYLPAGLAIDHENMRYFDAYVAPGYKIEHLIYIANQAGEKKICVYGFVKKK
jgi:sugar lactone lactonase YvrE